jgi:hypothetical protein
MKLKSIKIAIFSIAIAAVTFVAISWGPFGHEHINKAAVLALPEPVRTFFYNHIDFVTQESTVPDLRKYTLRDNEEKPRHYIDLENYGAEDTIPKTWELAKKKYDDKFLSSNGILPWYIQDVMVKLTKAFKDKRKTEILFLAADLGHYIGDAHMPLHTAVNHDGLLTNQKGIHALWEARIPEMFGKDYNFHTEEATYISNIEATTWSIINDSHSLIAPLLLADKNLRESIGVEKMYITDAKGTIAKNKFNDLIHTDDYVKKYNQALNGMVERQLRKAILMTSSYWYTAWVNAGKPDLSGLDTPEWTDRNKENLKADLKLWNQGKLFGLESEKDFD